jgi:hypothetical protein
MLYNKRRLEGKLANDKIDFIAAKLETVTR